MVHLTLVELGSLEINNGDADADADADADIVEMSRVNNVKL